MQNKYLFLTIFFSSAILSQDVYEDISNEKEISLDSISEPDSGNWYEKLQIFKSAKPKYEEVKELKEKVADLNNQFISKKEDDSKKFKDFYVNQKIDKNTVISKIDELIASIKIDENLDTSSLTDAQRFNLDKEIKNKKDLEDLKSNFNLLFLFESNFEKATLEISGDQLKSADSYQEKALDNFEKIKNTLDDKKAAFMLKVIENSIDNINSIIDYLSGPLMNSVNESWAKMNDLRVKIETSIKDLQAKGLIVSNLSDKEKEEIFNKLNPKKESKECKEEPVNKGILQKILDFILAIFNYLWALIKAPFVYVYSFFNKDLKEKPVPAPKEAIKFDNKSKI